MLVITRRVGESIWIGDDVRATILRIRGNRVQIGIQAANGTRIVRTETLSPEDDAVEPSRAASAAPLVPKAPPMQKAPPVPIITFPALPGGDAVVLG